MTEVTISGLVDSQRRLVVALPDEVPTGPVEVVIRSLSDQSKISAPLTREIARERLRAAGLLSEADHVSPNARQLTSDEREQLGLKLAGQPTSDQLIDEDRGVY